jgi:hypothetical protein
MHLWSTVPTARASPSTTHIDNAGSTNITVDPGTRRASLRRARSRDGWAEEQRERRRADRRPVPFGHSDRPSDGAVERAR